MKDFYGRPYNMSKSSTGVCDKT